MRRFAGATVVAATSFALCLTAAIPATATYPGKNGKIAFRRHLSRAGWRDSILTIEPDGAAERLLVWPHRHRIGYNDPDWSPNGRWIAYTREWERRGAPASAPRLRVIEIMRANGTHRTRLSDVSCPRPHQSGDCLGESIPAWSPNGRRIAFSREFVDRTDGDPDIFVMRRDGSHARRITDPAKGYEDWAPQWSPDGSRLVFFRYSAKRDQDAIFTVHLDGSHLRQLTPWRLNAAQSPDWSPNGRWILFAAHPGDQSVNLWMIHPNENGLHRITHAHGEAGWFSASFSPDGTKIVAGHAPGFGDAGNADVYVMNVDGTGVQNITHTPKWDSAPDWGPRPT